MTRHPCMHRRGHLFAGAVLISSAYVAPTQAQSALEIPAEYDVLPAWEIQGSNTLRWDFYRVEGIRANSPHPDLGPHFYDEFNFNGLYAQSPYDTWRGRLVGAYNHSDYRSEDFGLLIERATLLREDGGGQLPYRLELGDFFGFQSFRTIQRSLKGAQFELQPYWRRDRAERHSFQMFFGSSLQAYTSSTDYNDDLYVGGSWLIDMADTSLSANFTHNMRDKDIATNTARQRQQVFSLAGHHERLWWGQKLTFEGEAARFAGDPAGTGANATTNKNDNGFMAQVSGRDQSRPLTYTFRYERYGQNYQPNGAAVPANRETFSLRGGWRFEDGLAFTARAQRFVDQHESTNPTDTDVVGVNLSGPFEYTPIEGLNIGLNAFVQRSQNRDRTTDSDTQSATLNLSAPAGEHWNVRASLFLQAVENNANNSATSVSRQATLSATRNITFNGFSGSISPGLVFRHNTGQTSNQTDFGGDIAMSLARGPHTIDMSVRQLWQDPHTANSSDISSTSLNAAYGYTTGPHRFGLDGELSHREPENGGHTLGYRFGLFWSVALDKPNALTRKARAEQLSEATATAAAGDFPSELTLADLKPGIALAEAQARLAAAGIRGGNQQADFTVFRTQFFNSLDQVQQLAVQHDGERVLKSVVVIALDNVGDPDNAGRLFARVQRLLSRQYGAPQTFERGEFSQDFARDVNDGTLVRLSEWRVPGGAIRLGIPRRLDRQVRFEVQFATGFPPPTVTRWSVEPLR
ncbi:MAG: hypothetical protein AAF458_13665 [Pseudomonadota bacterium]